MALEVPLAYFELIGVRCQASDIMHSTDFDTLKWSFLET